MLAVSKQPDPDLLKEKLHAIRRELRDEYLQPHNKPWIVGFSGGTLQTFHRIPATILKDFWRKPAHDNACTGKAQKSGLKMRVPGCPCNLALR